MKTFSLFSLAWPIDLYPINSGLLKLEISENLNFKGEFCKKLNFNSFRNIIFS